MKSDFRFFSQTLLLKGSQGPLPTLPLAAPLHYVTANYPKRNDSHSTSIGSLNTSSPVAARCAQVKVHRCAVASRLSFSMRTAIPRLGNGESGPLRSRGSPGENDRRWSGNERASGVHDRPAGQRFRSFLAAGHVAFRLDSGSAGNRFCPGRA